VTESSSSEFKDSKKRGGSTSSSGSGRSEQDSVIYFDEDQWSQYWNLLSYPDLTKSCSLSRWQSFFLYYKELRAIGETTVPNCLFASPATIPCLFSTTQMSLVAEAIKSAQSKRQHSQNFISINCYGIDVNLPHDIDSQCTDPVGNGTKKSRGQGGGIVEDTKRCENYTAIVLGFSCCLCQKHWPLIISEAIANNSITKKGNW